MNWLNAEGSIISWAWNNPLKPADTNTKGIPKLRLLSTKAPSDGKNFCCLLINICSEIKSAPKNKIQKPIIPIITNNHEPNLTILLLISYCSRALYLATNFAIANGVPAADISKIVA